MFWYPKDLSSAWTKISTCERPIIYCNYTRYSTSAWHHALYNSTSTWDMVCRLKGIKKRRLISHRQLLIQKGENKMTTILKLVSYWPHKIERKKKYLSLKLKQNHGGTNSNQLWKKGRDEQPKERKAQQREMAQRITNL